MHFLSDTFSCFDTYLILRNIFSYFDTSLRDAYLSICTIMSFDNSRIFLAENVEKNICLIIYLFYLPVNSTSRKRKQQSPQKTMATTTKPKKLKETPAKPKTSAPSSKRGRGQARGRGRGRGGQASSRGRGRPRKTNT